MSRHKQWCSKCGHNRAFHLEDQLACALCPCERFCLEEKTSAEQQKEIRRLSELVRRSVEKVSR